MASLRSTPPAWCWIMAARWGTTYVWECGGGPGGAGRRVATARSLTSEPGAPAVRGKVLWIARCQMAMSLRRMHVAGGSGGGAARQQPPLCLGIRQCAHPCLLPCCAPRLQYTQLIARRVRENGVLSMLMPGDVTMVRPPGCCWPLSATAGSLRCCWRR